MKIDEIIKTKDEIEHLGYGIDNNIIKSIDINTIAHFGNCTCLEIECHCVYPIAAYNNTKNLGFLIQGLIELFDLSEEDGIRLSKIKNIPCRLVFNDKNCTWGAKCIGFGHFMGDKFVLIDDFVKLGL